MKINELICKCCGSNDVIKYNTKYVCTYCGTEHIIEPQAPTQQNNFFKWTYIFYCPSCGSWGSYNINLIHQRNDVCHYCHTKMIDPNPKVLYADVIGIGSDNMNKIIASFQPWDKFNHEAWDHRLKMQYKNNKEIPACFDDTYHPGKQLVQCPHCESYWTEKKKSIFKGEHWHCYFCEKDFKE